MFFHNICFEILQCVIGILASMPILFFSRQQEQEKRAAKLSQDKSVVGPVGRP